MKNETTRPAFETVCPICNMKVEEEFIVVNELSSESTVSCDSLEGCGATWGEWDFDKFRAQKYSTKVVYPGVTVVDVDYR